MKKLLDSTQDKKEKLKLIFFTKKLEIKLFIINETLEIIKNKIEIDQNSLDYNSEDDINKIFDYFFKILTYAQKINFNGIFVDIKEEVWENYVDEYYKSKKIKFLYLLRKNISKINNKKIIDKIDFYVDNLGFYFIDKKMIKNRLLLDFLNNDKILFIKISKEKIDKIAKCINLNSINEKDFIIEFKNFKFKNLFKNYYEYFLQKYFQIFKQLIYFIIFLKYILQKIKLILK